MFPQIGVEILSLRTDSIEQYSRLNNIRINGIPEQESEDTRQVVCQVIDAIGADVASDIDKCHRVGQVKTGPTSPPRSIIVKFTTSKSKHIVFQNKRRLNNIDVKQIFGDNWPRLSDSPSDKHRIYINEDLTRARAQAAAFGRDLKKRKQIDDTWTRDGAVFVKIGSKTSKLYNKDQIEQLLC